MQATHCTLKNVFGQKLKSLTNALHCCHPFGSAGLGMVSGTMKSCLETHSSEKMKISSVAAQNCYPATDKATRSQGAIWRTVGSLSLLASLQRIHEGLACGSLTRRLHALGQLVLLKLTHWLAACCRCRSTLMTMNHLSLTRAHDSIHRTIGHSHSGACRHAGHHGTHQPRHHATTRRSNRRRCCSWCSSRWRCLLGCSRSWLWCCPAIGRRWGSALRSAGGATAALTRHCRNSEDK